jgi:exonuclease SbcD
MRILHTSDWHLGRQFHGVSLIEDQRHALHHLLRIVRDEQVDVVVVAGDIYDRAVPPAEAVELLDEVLHALSHDCGVPVILIAGNHDSPERLGFGSRQLARGGVHITGPLRAEPLPLLLEDAHGAVAFYSLPFADPPVVREVLRVDVRGHQEAMQALTQQVREHNPQGRRCVLMAHCFLEGYAGSESERPLAIGGVETVDASVFEGFHYVALGHLHGAQARGAKHVRYSGSLLPYSFSESSDPKSVTLVDLDAEGKCIVRTVALQLRRGMRTVEGTLEEVLEKSKQDAAADDYVMVRITEDRAILDRMARLRAVYPNVLHSEQVRSKGNESAVAAGAERIARGELVMFQDFYQDLTGKAASEEHIKVMAEVITTAKRQGDL